MNENFRYTKLDNGLQLLGEINPHSRSSALGFFVKTGARDESPEIMGTSHFLEHMIFKGTKKRTALDINYELGALGAQANAFTSEENTVFYAGVLPENFSKTLDLFSDMLRPALRTEDFDIEKKVILEEIALYQDRPHYFLYEQAIASYFGNGSCGHSVLGSNQTITDLSAAQMKEYFERRYGSANTCLVASGNFNWENFVSQANELCSSWLPGDNTRQQAVVSEPAENKQFRKSSLSQAQVLILAKSLSAQDPLSHAMSVLSVILGDGSGSKMYWELVHSGLAESATCDHDEKDGLGLFTASASCEHDKLERCLTGISAIIDNAASFSDSELELAKKKLCSRIVTAGERSMGRLMAIGMEWNYRQKVTPLAELIEKIRSVTRQQIQQCLDKCPLKVRSTYTLVSE